MIIYPRKLTNNNLTYYGTLTIDKGGDQTLICFMGEEVIDDVPIILSSNINWMRNIIDTKFVYIAFLWIKNIVDRSVLCVINFNYIDLISYC